MGMPLTLPRNIPLPFWLTVRVRLTPVHPADFNFLTIIASTISNTKLIAFNSISKEKSTSWKEERRKVVKISFQYIYILHRRIVFAHLDWLADTCNHLQSLAITS